MTKLKYSLTLAAMTLCFVCLTYSQAGLLDTDFGVGGTQTVALSPGAGNAHPHNAVIQSDGKIVTLISHYATSSMLIRLNSDGSLDTSFGNGGIVTSSWLSSGTSGE